MSLSSLIQALVRVCIHSNKMIPHKDIKNIY